MLSNKKNLIEKTQKHKNGDSLRSGQNRQKSSKIDHFTVGGPCVRKMRFLPIFAPISKGRRFFVYRPFLSNYFLFESREKNVSFLICRIAHISISDEFGVLYHWKPLMLEKCWKLCQNMRKAQTKPKNETCAIPQNKNEIFYSVLSNKKKFDRKDPETKKRRFFEIRAKVGKKGISSLLGGKWGFCRFCPDFKRSSFFCF